MLVRGAAGTGKTTLTQEAVEAMEAAGKPVVVLAPSAEASRDVLRRRRVRRGRHGAAFLLKPEFQETARGGVIWVDEAGLSGWPTWPACSTRPVAVDAAGGVDGGFLSARQRGPGTGPANSSKPTPAFRACK